ncbi:hypothetical protein [Paenibacillus sanguinis]|uniref:hypothetical protein n=1 Tax=Paenibacillus sanguinis TaxID=225906 RepID=UPI00036EE801|nr:hypothetical protein [Paenibacillus sanguinis]
MATQKVKLPASRNKAPVNSAATGKRKSASPLPSYTYSELLNASEMLLGVKPEVFAGAAAGLEEEKLQVDVAKRLVKQFLGRKVR